MLYLFSWGTLSECEACLVNMEGWELFLFIQRTGQENLSSHPIIVHYKLVREPACMKPPACFLAGALPNSPSLSLSRCRFRWPEFPAASTRRVSRKSRVRESENVLCSALLLLLLLIRCPFSAPPSRVEIPLGGRLPIRGIETCVRAPEAQHASIYSLRFFLKGAG
jgi:hypothetical protein